MKNTLAENMRRFGTKNLMEQHVNATTGVDANKAYFEKTPTGTMQTANRKPVMLNRVEVAPGTELAKSTIADYDLISDKRLYGTKTWTYTYKNGALSLRDEQGYTAWIRTSNLK